MCCPGFSQVDVVGSGRIIDFDGVDDYVDVGNVYDNLTFPMTISAWIYKEPSSFLISPIFVSQDNASLYNGFWFCLSQTNLFFEYGDGRGDQSSAYRRGKSVPLNNIENRWIHVAAVVKSGTDIQLFANGKNAGGSYTGSSTLPMASDYPGDVAKVGYFLTNSVTHRFKGAIDELRIWNRALTEQEIRESMCARLTGTEPGLIGYWNFDETSGDIVLDESPNGFNGTLKGNPQRVFSGAPVGDESNFLYTTSWTGKELLHKGMQVSNIQGISYGVHIYSVNSAPSQTGGLDPSAIPSSYYGIFLAEDSGSNTFDFSLTNGDVGCNVFQRNDNSVAQWSRSNTFDNVQSRIEIIASSGGMGFDIDLGDDEEWCAFEPRILSINLETDDLDITWQDGSSEKYFLAKSFGTYWVKVANACGELYDTITFSEKKKVAITEQYNFMSPDNYDSDNQYLTLHDVAEGNVHLTVFNRWGKEVYRSANYDNRWDGGDLPSGVYFYTIQGDCFEPYKGTVTIMR